MLAVNLIDAVEKDHESTKRTASPRFFSSLLVDGSTAGELIPELVRHGLQQLIELEVAAVLGAERYDHSEELLGYRNGHRPRLLTTQVGDIDLRIPKLRSGSFLPSILEPRRRVDQALYAVVMEAYAAGVSTRKIDSLVAALGSQSGISKSQVSWIRAMPACISMPPISTAGWAVTAGLLQSWLVHQRLGAGRSSCGGLACES